MTHNGSGSMSTGPSMRDSYNSASQSHFEGDGHNHGRRSDYTASPKSDYK